MGVEMEMEETGEVGKFVVVKVVGEEIRILQVMYKEWGKQVGYL